MKLTTWMKKNKTSYREMAKKIKMPHTTLYRYATKQREVSAKAAVKISEHTNGEVSVEELAK